MTNNETSGYVPEHTFVVMAYGNSPFLPECLDSLLCQTVRGEICIATSTPSGYLSEQAMRAGATLFVTGSGERYRTRLEFCPAAGKDKICNTGSPG
jgi:hypothetical protein